MLELESMGQSIEYWQLIEGAKHGMQVALIVESKKVSWVLFRKASNRMTQVAFVLWTKWQPRSLLVGINPALERSRSGGSTSYARNLST